MRRVACICCMVIAMLAASSVSAWGPQGHRLVGLIAARHLTPVAKENVEWLIGPQTLADVSTWADQIRNDNYQTYGWHFLNIPPDAKGYDRDRDCPRQPGVAAGTRADRWRDCAVDRILYTHQQLADTTLDRADRAIALKYLVHFIGDLHQPFHALGVAQGGNGIPVSAFGSDNCGNDPAKLSPCNLHGIWDSTLIARRGLDDAKYLAVLDQLIANNQWTAKAALAPAEWAVESWALGKTALVAPESNIDQAYYQKQITVIDQRLAQGGLRLAASLNAALTTPPPRARTQPRGPAPRDEDLINADRPGIADTSTVVEARQLQLETGFHYEHRRAQRSGLIPTLVRVGLGHGVEARFEGNTFSRVEGVRGDASHNVSGFAPLSVGFEYNVLEPIDERHPGVGVIARVTPAWGSGEFRAHRVTGDVRLAVDWDVAPKLALNPNVGFGVYEGDDETTFAAGLFALTLAYAHTAKLNLFIDTGIQAPERRDGLSSIIVDGGVAYIIGQNIQIDVSTGAGVHGDTTPQPFVAVGFSIRSRPRVP